VTNPSGLNIGAIDYSSRDFASLRQSLLTQAALLMPEWQGAVRGDPNDMGVLLLELLAYEGDILSYYNDVVANEAYLSTATQRDSVIAHAKELGYTPRSALSANCVVTITVTSPVKCILPRGFQVSTLSHGSGSPIIFETQDDLVFAGSTATPAVAQSIDVSVIEGVTVLDEIIGISTGALDQFFTLARTPVVASSVVLRVVESPLDAGTVWFATNSLLNTTGVDNAYSYALNSTDAVTVTFGDGVNGRVPPRGSVIHAHYRVGGGADGNVIAGTVTTVLDPTDVVFPQNDPTKPVLRLGTGSNVVPPLISVVNANDASGGSDSESLDSIRVNAPKSLRSLDRAVALEDFENLALNIPQVHITKARAVGAVYSNITLYVAVANGAQVTTAVLNAVTDYFGPRKMAGVTVVAATPTFAAVDISIAVVIDPRYDQDNVRLSSLRAVQALFNYDVVNFGQRITVGSVYTAALAHPGVLNIVVSKMVRTLVGGTSSSDIALQANEIPTLGTLTVTATGGVVNSGLSNGQGTPSAPPSAPTVVSLTARTNAVHASLSWTQSTDTTTTDVRVDYLNALGNTILSTTVGPFTATTAEFDLPLIGSNVATQIRFTIRAYKGFVGPVAGLPTTTPYTYA
jgi:hypothetical protein